MTRLPPRRTHRPGRLDSPAARERRRRATLAMGVSTQDERLIEHSAVRDYEPASRCVFLRVKSWPARPRLSGLGGRPTRCGAVEELSTAHTAVDGCTAQPLAAPNLRASVPRCERDASSRSAHDTAIRATVMAAFMLLRGIRRCRW